MTNRWATHTSWIHQMEGWFTVGMGQEGAAGDFVALFVMVQNLELRNYFLLSFASNIFQTAIDCR